MRQKAQHDRSYAELPGFLRQMREDAGMTQRDMAARLGKAQSWVHNCETANRRVDVTEFIAWCEVCGLKPKDAFARVLRLVARFQLGK